MQSILQAQRVPNFRKRKLSRQSINGQKVFFRKGWRKICRYIVETKKRLFLNAGPFQWLAGDLPLLVAIVGLLFFLQPLFSQVQQLALRSMPLSMAAEPSLLLERHNSFSAQAAPGVGGSIDTTSLNGILPFSIIRYTLQSGDTISEIAQEFNLAVDTLVSFNAIENVRSLRAGQSIRIPSQDGIIYRVRAGETLDSIARGHNIQLTDILDANHLSSKRIQAEQVLFLPDVKMNSTELRLALGELFIFPTSGRISSQFGVRNDPFTGLRRFHHGLDIAGYTGTPIRASDSGRVVHIGNQVNGYGRYLILRHGSEFQTLYGHLNSISVTEGQYIARGDIIATMGNTGRSTGPHLHFSVIRRGNFVNPIPYLP